MLNVVVSRLFDMCLYEQTQSRRCQCLGVQCGVELVKAWCWVLCCEGVVYCVVLSCWCSMCVVHPNTFLHMLSPTTHTRRLMSRHQKLEFHSSPGFNSFSPSLCFSACHTNTRDCISLVSTAQSGWSLRWGYSGLNRGHARGDGCVWLIARKQKPKCFQEALHCLHHWVRNVHVHFLTIATRTIICPRTHSR